MRILLLVLVLLSFPIAEASAHGSYGYGCCSWSSDCCDGHHRHGWRRHRRWRKHAHHAHRHVCDAHCGHGHGHGHAHASTHAGFPPNPFDGQEVIVDGHKWEWDEDDHRWELD